MFTSSIAPRRQSILCELAEYFQNCTGHESLVTNGPDSASDN